MNQFTSTPFDPRNRSPLGGLTRLSLSPQRRARAIRATIQNSNWRGLSKRVPASLRGDTRSKPSGEYPEHRAIYRLGTGEFLGWRDAAGRFCPAGE